MTLAFRGELKRQLHDTAQQLSESRDQLSRQDKQIDFMRSQLDRRRLELETQRRKFIHEILGMHSSKGTSNAALTDVLKHAFKDDTKEDLSSSTRRGGLHEGMGLTHLAKASSEAKMKQQTEQLMKLKKRMTALQEQLNAQQEFSDSIREQRDHWEKIAKELANGEKNQEEKIKKMKLGMKFSSRVRLASAMKKQAWWNSISETTAMLEMMKESTISNKEMKPEKGEQLFNSLLCFFGSIEIQDWFLPRYFHFYEKEKHIAIEKNRGVIVKHATAEDDNKLKWMHNVSLESENC